MKDQAQPTLWAEVQRLGIEHANHESDLYLPDTEQVRELLKQYPEQSRSTFRNRIDGKIWLDLPFAFLPWWEKRMPAAKTDA